MTRRAASTGVEEQTRAPEKNIKVTQFENKICTAQFFPVLNIFYHEKKTFALLKCLNHLMKLNIQKLNKKLKPFISCIIKKQLFIKNGGRIMGVV